MDNLAKLYGSMSADDKNALKELKASEEKRVGKVVPLSDIIAAVTPGMAEPKYLSA